MDYIISQIFVILGYTVIAFSFFTKNRKLILLYSTAAVVCHATSYAFLLAWTGVAMNIIALGRNVTFQIQNKYKKSSETTKSDWIVLGSIIAVSTTAWILTYDGILSFFALSGTLIYTYAVWQKNAKVYNILAIIGSIQWIVYYLFVFSVFGIILECVMLVAETIGTIRYFKQDKKLLLEKNKI
jgi:hypothetical protein